MKRIVLAFLVAASAARAAPKVPQVIAPQQLIVSCSPAVLPSVCADVVASVGGVVSAVGQTVFDLVTLPGGVPLQPALDTLRASTAIASAEPNRILIGSTAHPQTWHFPAMGTPGDADLLPPSASPIVAVLDTGIAYESDPLGIYAQASSLGGARFVQGWDFVNNDAHPDDDNGHGTGMATIIAGSGSFSGIPYVGPAAGATLLPIKVLDANDQGTEFWLEEGIRYAITSGASVINLSLDFARNYVSGGGLRDAMAEARAAGVLIVAASGNTGT